MRRRGQSTLELALILPLIVGLIVLALQAGILISDQVHLEHFAYEGAQWAVANPLSATVDPSGHPGTGTIAQHIYSVICGGPTSFPSTSGTKYCNSEPSGVPALSVAVTSVATPTSMVIAGPSPTGQVLGSSSCKQYHLSVAPRTVTLNQTTSTTASFTITSSIIGGSGNDPQVSLAYSVNPALTGLVVPPVFVPTQIPGRGGTSVMTLQTGPSTPPSAPGSPYVIQILGTDNCNLTGSQPPATDAQISLTVNGTAPSPSPSSQPVKVGITGVLPGLICLDATSPISLSGFGFQAGATVSTGPLVSPSVTVVSSTQITFDPVALAAGAYDVKVTNPDGSTATLGSALQVTPSCSSPTQTPPGGCCDSGSSGVPTATTVTDATKSWTANQWVGATVTMNGSTAIVVSNTATTLTVSSWSPGAPTAPAPYQVQFNNAAGCSAGGGSGTPAGNQVTDATKSWSINQLVGDVLIMNGATGTVTANTGTTVTVAGWTGPAPSATGPYELQVPGGQCREGICAAGTGGFQTVITITWYEPLVIPMFAISGTPYFTLRAVQVAFCQ